MSDLERKLAELLKQKMLSPIIELSDRLGDLSAKAEEIMQKKDPGEARSYLRGYHTAIEDIKEAIDKVIKNETV